jgi:hypothetical protein
MAQKVRNASIQGVVSMNRAGRDIVVIRTAQGNAVFNKVLIDTVCQSAGISTAQLGKYAKMYNVSFDINQYTAGQIVKGRKGEDITITKDHDRFENLSIELKDEFLSMSLNADAIGAAMSKSFSLPVVKAPVAPVAIVEEPANDAAPVAAEVVVEDAQPL